MGVFLLGLIGGFWRSDSARNWVAFFVGSTTSVWREDKLTDLVLGRWRSGSGSGWWSLEWESHEFKMGVEELLRSMVLALPKDRFEKGTSRYIYTGESEKGEKKYRDGGGDRERKTSLSWNGTHC